MELDDDDDDDDDDFNHFMIVFLLSHLLSQAVSVLIFVSRFTQSSRCLCKAVVITEIKLKQN